VALDDPPLNKLSFCALSDFHYQIREFLHFRGSLPVPRPGTAAAPVVAREVFDLNPTSTQSATQVGMRGMATIPELLDGHVTLEVECLDRLYLNGYIGKLATGLGLVMFMREQLVQASSVPGQCWGRYRKGPERP